MIAISKLYTTVTYTYCTYNQRQSIGKTSAQADIEGWWWQYPGYKQHWHPSIMNQNIWLTCISRGWVSSNIFCIIFLGDITYTMKMQAMLFIAGWRTKRKQELYHISLETLPFQYYVALSVKAGFSKTLPLQGRVKILSPQIRRLNAILSGSGENCFVSLGQLGGQT